MFGEKGSQPPPFTVDEPTALDFLGAVLASVVGTTIKHSVAVTEAVVVQICLLLSKDPAVPQLFPSVGMFDVHLLGAAKAQARQILPLLGDFLAAGRKFLGLLVDLILQNAARLLRLLHALRLLFPDAGPDAALIQALHLCLELRDGRGVLFVDSTGGIIGAMQPALQLGDALPLGDVAGHPVARSVGLRFHPPKRVSSAAVAALSCFADAYADAERAAFVTKLEELCTASETNVGKKDLCNFNAAHKRLHRGTYPGADGVSLLSAGLSRWMVDLLHVDLIHGKLVWKWMHTRQLPAGQLFVPHNFCA
eukprot:6185786-Pleurochrysis_carterae.AAC.1